jgi:hypothetical protein
LREPYGTIWTVAEEETRRTEARPGVKTIAANVISAPTIEVPSPAGRFNWPPPVPKRERALGRRTP